MITVHILFATNERMVIENVIKIITRGNFISFIIQHHDKEHGVFRHNALSYQQDLIRRFEEIGN